MDRRRVVGVDALAGPASGCAIGGRLVLTSAHAVAGPSGGGAAAVGVRVRVFRPGEAGTFGAVVVWCGHVGGRDDAALLRVDDGPGWAEPRPVRWGRLVTDRTGVDCQAWGLPEHAQRDGWAAQVEQSSGWLNPGTGYVADRYVMTVRESAPGWDRPVPVWGGMSGGAVFCGPLLTGVVTAERAYSGNGQLVLSPAYALHHDPAFGAALAAHGLLVADLEAVELHELADQAAHPERYGAPARSPAALLHATRRIVPFHGRDALLGQLRNWSEPAGFDACLVHGPAGQGKTRLAQEFAREQAARGWAVLWPQPALGADELLELREVTRPLLVVLDYAESRTEQLVGLVRAAADHSGSRPFKVLLLARARGDWWERDLRSRIGEQLDGAPEWALGGLEDDLPADRPELYRAVVERFAAALPALPGCDGPDWAALAAAQTGPGGLGGKRYSNPLTLHMTALADLLDAARPGAHRGGAQRVEDRLLDHERSYWVRAAQARGLASVLSPDTLEAALAAAHLCGAATLEQARELWLRVPVVADQPTDMRERVTRWLADLYPVAPPHPFGALQPDRLAERQVARVLLADPGLAGGLVAGADRAQRAQLVTVYVRAAADPLLAGGLDRHLTELCVRHHDRLARAVVDAATRSARPAPLVAALRAVIEDRGRSLLELRLLQALFPPVSVVLADTAVQLGQRVVDECRAADPGGGESALAAALRDLAEAFGEVGRLDEAVATARESVELRRRLAERDPEKQLPRLALALGTLSKVLLLAGRNQESLPVLREAVVVGRGLTGLDGDHPLDAAVSGLAVRPPDAELSQATRESVERFRLLAAADAWAYLPNLALMLALQAAGLADAGLIGEAVTVAREAVERLRAQADPDREIVLVRVLALGVLSGCLSSAGRPEEAAEAAREAVAGLRGPDAAAEPGLGQMLAGLSRILGEAGSPEEAAALAREGVGRLRPLAEDDPDTHLHSLAKELNNLAVQLGGLGEWEAALEAAAESVRHHRRLAGLGSGVHRQTLAGSLVVLSKALSDLGRWEESLAATREAAEQFRAVGEHPLGQAMALTNGARALHAQGRYGEALAAAELASAGFRALPPGGGRDQLLAEALGLRALSLCALGEWDEAVALGRESLATGGRAPGARQRSAAAVFALFGALSESGRDEEALSVIAGTVEEHRAPGVPPGALGVALTLYAKGLCGAGRTDEAVLVGEEAVDRCRALADRNPAAHLMGLCLALNVQSASLGADGQWARAVEVAREAVAVCRRGLAVQPELVEQQLAIALGGLATGLGELGESEQALVAGAESVAYFRSVAGRLSKAFGPALVEALHALAEGRRAAGRWAEALTDLGEAVEIGEALAEADPDRHAELYGRVASLRAAMLSASGRWAEAVTAGTEVVERLRRLGQDGGQLVEFTGALTLRAGSLLILGRWEEALADAEEAVGLLRRSPDRPARLALALSSLAEALVPAGRAEEALAAGAEAVELFRAAVPADGQRVEMAGALGGLAGALVASGRLPEAVAATEEAAGLLRAAAAHDPRTCQPLLKRVLATHLLHLGALGRWEEVLVVSREIPEWARPLPGDAPLADRSLSAGVVVMLGRALAEADRWAEAAEHWVAAFRQFEALAQDRPELYRAALAEAAGLLAGGLLALDRPAEAAAVNEEAVAWTRAADLPGAAMLGAAVAGGWGAVAMALARQDRFAEAAEAWREAVGHRRWAAGQDPDRWLPTLVDALHALAGALLGADRPAESLAAAQECTVLGRALFEARDGGPAPAAWLADVLDIQTMGLHELDRPAEAAAVAEESVACRRDLAAADPAARPALAAGLVRLAVWRAEDGRDAEAAVALREALGHYRVLVEDDPETFAEELEEVTEFLAELDAED